MKCVLDGPNAIGNSSFIQSLLVSRIKNIIIFLVVLAKAIHCLSRIGHDLYVDATTSEGLTLRTVNKASSAFGQIKFNPIFFSSFEVSPPGVHDDDLDRLNENKCKLAMRSCLSVFRNMKSVITCTIGLDTERSKFMVKMICHKGLVKTHSVFVLEHETLQAAYATDQVPNQIWGSHKVFDRIVENFMSNEEELTFEAATNQLDVRNYVEGTMVDKRFMRSHMQMK